VHGVKHDKRTWGSSRLATDSLLLRWLSPAFSDGTGYHTKGDYPYCNLVECLLGGI